MKRFPYSPFKNSIKKILQSPWVAKKRRFSFGFLNITQFLGVLNDNLYKLLMVFLLIDAIGQQQASGILSAAGAIYVIPFLLFSSSAGILADRFSKQKLILILKTSEVFIMILASIAFAFKSIWGCYTLLFLLATHSAMFGPSKYGIIPELVSKDYVSKANGIITSFTYLAIILGTFLASFLTEVTNRGFIVTVLFCLLIAIAGFLSALGIRRTPAQNPSKSMNLLFVREIYRTLQEARNIKFLVPCIFGSAYFLFIGAFTQLNIIPFALQALHLREVAGGYLFLLTALGIASGSFLTGKLLKKKLELGISCLAGFGIAAVFFFIYIFSSYLIPTVLFLILLGILGGIFIIPFDTFIQISSPIEKRGQVIASTNFLSFVGVLIASLALYVFSQVLGLSAALGFATMGFITLVVVAILCINLAEVFLPFFSKHVLFKIFAIHSLPDKPTSSSEPIYLLEKATFLKSLIVSGLLPDAHFLLKKPKNKWLRYFAKKMPHFHFSSAEENLENWEKEAVLLLERYPCVCILMKGPYEYEPQNEKNKLISFFQKPKILFYVIKIEKNPQNGRFEIHFLK
jgi:acyl-[acyl-carrier-protein]-phospholipid O-acyltransferase / long-chain-fatty-acid--[acyl-carrier-protein] ligase